MFMRARTHRERTNILSVSTLSNEWCFSWAGEANLCVQSVKEQRTTTLDALPSVLYDLYSRHGLLLHLHQGKIVDQVGL